MKVVAVLALLVVNLHLSRSCSGVESVLICQQIQGFLPGFTSLVLIVQDVGHINSTVLRSEALASFTGLRINGAGVTGIGGGAFSSLVNLSSLSLEQNLLVEIDPRWFGRPAALNRLELAGNRVEVLTRAMLNGFSGLSKLNLSSNRVRTIDPDCFGSQTDLGELDLSENRMTRFPPQVFGSLRSTRMRLHGNPWDCSCDATDFGVFLQDLRSRSLLEEEMKVTCGTPPSLIGRPVWNVSACVTSLPPGPPAPPQTVQPQTVQPQTVQPQTVQPQTVQPQTVQPQTTDALTTERKSTATLTTKPASPSRPETTSLRDVPPPATTTEAVVTFPPRPQTWPNVVPALSVVIALLCLLLCVLAVLHRRKRNSKAVMPRSQKEESVEAKGRAGSGLGSPGLSDNVTGHKLWDSEVGWRKDLTGVRAKSANALLLTSPFCASAKNQVASQTETEASEKDTENPSEGEQTPQNESEAAGNITRTQDDALAGTAESVPYLSIGTNVNMLSPEQPADTRGQRSQAGRRMLRICTWPPTAVQWKERCDMKGPEGEGESFRVEGEGGKAEDFAFLDEQEVRAEQTEEATGLTQDSALSEVATSKINKISETRHVAASCLNEAQNQTDVKQEEQLKAGSVPQPQKQNLESLQPAGDQKVTGKSSEGEQRNEAKARGNGPEAVNHGNDSYGSACTDLLHEVVQNNGRWTRETWRQVNKQRHNPQGQ